VIGRCRFCRNFRCRCATEGADVSTENESRALAEISHELEFGLGGPRTVREIGRHLGISKSRVEQLEQQAMRKLKRAADRSPTALAMRGDR
jgi:DNA-directed RNA polymerase sigma subunit (sigma70/sigma32)